MSRALSTAHLALEQSNVFLEDIILAELEGGKGDLNPVLLELKKSEDALLDFQKCISDLHDNMRRNNYSDLPTLHVGDLSAAGSRLDTAGIVQMPEWQEVLATMKNGSFYSVLTKFADLSSLLISHTTNLKEKMLLLQPVVKKGTVNLLLEENREGNIKVEFARLYTAWNRFHRLFLASSILSTELWYAFTNHGSLLGGGSQADVA